MLEKTISTLVDAHLSAVFVGQKKKVNFTELFNRETGRIVDSFVDSVLPKNDYNKPFSKWKPINTTINKVTKPFREFFYKQRRAGLKNSLTTLLEDKHGELGFFSVFRDTLAEKLNANYNSFYTNLAGYRKKNSLPAVVIDIPSSELEGRRKVYNLPTALYRVNGGARSVGSNGGSIQDTYKSMFGSPGVLVQPEDGYLHIENGHSNGFSNGYHSNGTHNGKNGHHHDGIPHLAVAIPRNAHNFLGNDLVQAIEETTFMMELMGLYVLQGKPARNSRGRNQRKRLDKLFRYDHDPTETFLNLKRQLHSHRAAAYSTLHGRIRATKGTISPFKLNTTNSGNIAQRVREKLSYLAENNTSYSPEYREMRSIALEYFAHRNDVTRREAFLNNYFKAGSTFDFI